MKKIISDIWEQAKYASGYDQPTTKIQYYFVAAQIFISDFIEYVKFTYA